jgi:hypothetical protein
MWWMEAAKAQRQRKLPAYMDCQIAPISSNIPLVCRVSNVSDPHQYKDRSAARSASARTGSAPPRIAVRSSAGIAVVLLFPGLAGDGTRLLTRWRRAPRTFLTPWFLRGTLPTWARCSWGASLAGGDIWSWELIPWGGTSGRIFASGLLWKRLLCGGCQRCGYEDCSRK